MDSLPSNDSIGKWFCPMTILARMVVVPGVASMTCPGWLFLLFRVTIFYKLYCLSSLKGLKAGQARSILNCLQPLLTASCKRHAKMLWKPPELGWQAARRWKVVIYFKVSFDTLDLGIRHFFAIVLNRAICFVSVTHRQRLYHRLWALRCESQERGQFVWANDSHSF